jgi:hypothetical protein
MARLEGASGVALQRTRSNDLHRSRGVRVLAASKPSSGPLSNSFLTVKLGKQPVDCGHLLEPFRFKAHRGDPGRGAASTR